MSLRKKMQEISGTVQIAGAMALQTEFGRRVVADVKRRTGKDISEQDLMQALDNIVQAVASGLDNGSLVGEFAKSCLRIAKGDDNKPDNDPPPPANDDNPRFGPK